MNLQNTDYTWNEQRKINQRDFQFDRGRGNRSITPSAPRWLLIRFDRKKTAARAKNEGNSAALFASRSCWFFQKIVRSLLWSVIRRAGRYHVAFAGIGMHRCISQKRGLLDAYWFDVSHFTRRGGRNEKKAPLNGYVFPCRYALLFSPSPHPHPPANFPRAQLEYSPDSNAHGETFRDFRSNEAATVIRKIWIFYKSARRCSLREFIPFIPVCTVKMIFDTT